MAWEPGKTVSFMGRAPNLEGQYEAQFEVWRERERQKQKVNEARFREVVHGAFGWFDIPSCLGLCFGFGGSGLFGQ